jgi:signal transduction histidine kinase
MARDVMRLEKVAERFSKIGSKPDLSTENIVNLVHQTINYLKTRSSSKINFSVTPGTEKEILVPVNGSLLGWVIENICKNSIDATEGEGDIGIAITEAAEGVFIDITDNGKGIPKSAYKKIFQPGYTTKERGWGLGLSLVKRIIEEYHHGKIFVRHSEPGKGTGIRIILKKGSG